MIDFRIEFLLILRLFILFVTYSFFGWIIEVGYRSFTNKRFINAGFLTGPFVLIYGIGAFTIIAFNTFIQNDNILIKATAYFIGLSLIEYLTGFFAEKLLKIKLWDYTGYFLNIQGHICLSFSLIWMGIALLFDLFVHPFGFYLVNSIPNEVVFVISLLSIVYLTTDFTISVISLKSFREKIFDIYKHSNYEKIVKNYNRLLLAFPDLKKMLNEKITDAIKDKINGKIVKIKGNITSKIRRRKPSKKEFKAIIFDIIQNEEFLKLKNFFHHNSSIYSHVLKVAYLTYKIAKYLNIDYVSATRGAMLHDFFLYDWRNHDVPDLAKEKFHGFEHPKIALENARKNFELNEIEKDIIVKHMWPLTLAIPKYKESYVVTFVDKYVSSKEFLNNFIKKRKA